MISTLTLDKRQVFYADYSDSITKTNTNEKTFDISEKIGKNVIKFQKNENLTINLKNGIKEQVEYIVKKKDIILKVYGTTLENAVDRKILLGKIIIKNGANKSKYGETGSLNIVPETDDVMHIGNSQALKKQLLKGSFRDENFIDGIGNDTIKTIAGDNNIFLGNGGTNSVYLGEGKDNVVFSPQKGNNIAPDNNIIYNADDNDTISFKNTTLNFYKSGNDLIITTNNNLSEGSDKVKGRITIKDYISSENKPAIEMNNEDFIYTLKNDSTISCYDKNNDTTTDIDLITAIEGKGQLWGMDKIIPIITYPENPHHFDIAPTSQVFFANGESTIFTGGGDDTIYTSSASDYISVNGSGTKTIYIDANSGSDNLSTSSEYAIIKLQFDNLKSDIAYERFENDLIMKYTCTGFDTKTNSNVDKDNTLTLRNYFASGRFQNYIFDREQYIHGHIFPPLIRFEPNISYSKDSYNQEFTAIGDELAAINLSCTGIPNQSNFISGTKYNDIVTGGNKSDIIMTGEGNDTITPGKGDDNIFIDGSGDKTVVITGGDGNDTIEFANELTGKLTLEINTPFDGILKKDGTLNSEKYKKAIETGKYVFTKNGNDLIYGNVNNKNKKECITIKNYFNGLNKNENIPDIDFNIHPTFKGNETASVPQNLDTIIINGRLDSETGITLFEGINFGTNVYKYSGENPAQIVSNNSSDKIYAKLNKKTNLFISDYDTDTQKEDSLIIKSKASDIKLFFNVGIEKDESGSIISSEIKVTDDNLNTDNLFILKKSFMSKKNIAKILNDSSGQCGNTKGIIGINNYFSAEGSGTGYIEKISLGTSETNAKWINMTEWINSVKSNIVGWLADNGYNSTFEVFDRENNSNDINSLLKAYMTKID